MSCWAVVLAAGKSTRLRHASTVKQFALYKGIPLFWHCAHILAQSNRLAGVVIMFPPRREGEEHKQAEYEMLLQECHKKKPLLCKLLWGSGGERRQDSVFNSLQLVDADCQSILIHDAARPFFTPKLVHSLLDTFEKENVQGLIPALAIPDTIKVVDSSNIVEKTLDREVLRAVQTPQCFNKEALYAAHLAAQKFSWPITDDAQLIELNGGRVLIIEGERNNKKITYAEDLFLLDESEQTEHDKEYKKMKKRICSGLGYDVHKYGGERALILGGVTIPTSLTIAAHSDGDIVLHALMDALLACIAKGDIGTHFPDSDAVYENISSGVLLAEVLEMCWREKLEINHVDITIVAQVPKLNPFREQIAANVAKLLAIPKHYVNVKATTEEKLGFTGEKKGIKCYALVSGLLEQ